MSRFVRFEAESEGVPWARSSSNFREQNWDGKRIYQRSNNLNGDQVDCREQQELLMLRKLS